MLPEVFKERMKRLLGDEYGSFIESFDEPDVRGVRINALKVSPEEFIKRTKIPLTPLGYAPDGYTLGTEMAVGASAEHHAGIFYMQDPGAMAPVAASDIKTGASVIDLCAAPGGKSTQAAAIIGDGGFILCNEYVPKRAKITVSNLERLGVRCAFVTSLDTAELARLYANYFDVVIADVPCSGEGMFRKNPEARDEWSEGEIASCALRDREILENAAKLTASGGQIIYSTCTWAPEECEEVIFDFLSCHPEFHLIPVREEVRRVTSDGINRHGEAGSTLALCRRFYPHKSPGEGQFVALLERENDGKKPTILYKGQEKQLSREERACVESFLHKVLETPLDARCVKVGENIVLISHGVPVPPRSVFSAGVLVGEVRRGVLTPSHQFFSAYGHLFRARIELSGDPERLRAYLHGEEIAADAATPDGYVAVTYMGAVLGGAKVSAGRAKNHYPKGLRNP